MMIPNLWLVDTVGKSEMVDAFLPYRLQFSQRFSLVIVFDIIYLGKVSHTKI